MDPVVTVRSHARGAALALALLWSMPHQVVAGSVDYTVGFATLPSAQGWSYFSGGVLAPETPTWALSAGVLTYNTMDYLTNASGPGTTSSYRRNGIITGTEWIVCEMRGRILQHEHDGSAFIGGGFTFGFGTGSQGNQMGILPTQIRAFNNAVIATVDNTQFHDYRMEWIPGPTVRFYVDNVLVSTLNASFSTTANGFYFGDGTLAANARAEITYARFRQGDAVTAATSGSWGRVKRLYR